jgi:hypothetical protein
VTHVYCARAAQFRGHEPCIDLAYLGGDAERELKIPTISSTEEIIT